MAHDAMNLLHRTLKVMTGFSQYNKVVHIADLPDSSGSNLGRHYPIERCERHRTQQG